MDPITGVDAVGASFQEGVSPKARSTGFAEALTRALDGVNSSQQQAAKLSQEFQLENPSVGIEETMLAVNKANIAFQALVQVRNRVLAAYQDIMNMQV